MVHGVKADAESSNFQRVVSLPAPGDLLNAIPVLHRENSIVVHVQCCACKDRVTVPIPFREVRLNRQ